MGKLPPGVALVVATLKVDPVSDAGFRLGVTPTGWPRTVTARFTVAANPFNELSVMVLVPVLPCVTSIVSGDGVNEKFGPVYTGPSSSSRTCPFGLPHPVTKVKPPPGVFGVPGPFFFPPPGDVGKGAFEPGP